MCSNPVATFLAEHFFASCFSAPVSGTSRCPCCSPARASLSPWARSTSAPPRGRRPRARSPPRARSTAAPEAPWPRPDPATSLAETHQRRFRKHKKPGNKNQAQTSRRVNRDFRPPKNKRRGWVSLSNNPKNDTNKNENTQKGGFPFGFPLKPPKQKHTPKNKNNEGWVGFHLLSLSHHSIKNIPPKNIRTTQTYFSSTSAAGGLLEKVHRHRLAAHEGAHPQRHVDALAWRSRAREGLKSLLSEAPGSKAPMEG